jgi:hypothetical protein
MIGERITKDDYLYLNLDHGGHEPLTNGSLFRTYKKSSRKGSL